MPLFELGRGGMGYVIAAYDETTRTRIAVKRLLPELRNDRSRGMFTREAKLLTQLRHPNIVRGISFGEDDEGPYLVMDLVNGVTLDELIASREGGVPPAIACRVLSDVCAGLAAAHELRGEDGDLIGLVHRDVTPHNVALDLEGRTLLFDFGVAKVDESSRLSKTGEVKGKTGYMSPEQAMGDPLDPRSDLFAVGALLYELLTGTKMWGGTEMEVLRALALGSPPELPEKFDPRLRALYSSLVSRSKEGRPRSAAEVVATFAEIGTSSHREIAALLRERFPTRGDETNHRVESAVKDLLQPKKRPSLPPNSSEGAGASGDSQRADSARVNADTKRSRAIVALVTALVVGGTFTLFSRSRESTAQGDKSSSSVGATSIGPSAPPSTSGSSTPSTPSSVAGSSASAASSSVPSASASSPLATKKLPRPAGSGNVASPAGSGKTAPTSSAQKPPSDVDPDPI